MNIKRILKGILPEPLKSSYCIGFLNCSELNLPTVERYGRIKWVENPKGSWYADPFIYKNADCFMDVFVEEMNTSKHPAGGVITKLRIDKNSYKVLDKKILLSLPTHLSFPIFINENGKTYVYPENYQSGSVIIYEYNEQRELLTNPRTIIDEPLLDTQIVKIGNEYYAFGVKYVTGLQEDTKILYIYKSHSLTGHYDLFQTITNTRCEERGAGIIFKDANGRIIRPAQCCEGGYGKAVIFYELDFVDGVFTETEIGRLEPNPKAKNGQVLHTFNQWGECCVIDGLRVYYPHLGKIYKKIRQIPE